MANDFYSKNQALRKLVPVEADRNLANWGDWRRSGQHVRGYPTRSTILETLGGCASEDASDHVYEAQNNWRAQVADSVIDELEKKHQMAISHVYEAGVWKPELGVIEDVFVEAVNAFWDKAQRKGLI
jgi:hypothetical protein